MAGKGKGPLRIAIEDFFETFHLGDLIRGGIKTWMEAMEDEGIKVYQNTINTFYPGLTLPNQMQVEKVKTAVKTSQVGILVWILAMIGLIAGGFTGFGQPSGRTASYFMDAQLRSYRPSPSELAVLRRRYPAFAKDAELFSNDLGVPDSVRAAYEVATQTLLNPQEMITLYYRQQVTLDEVNDILGRQGYTPQTIEKILELGHQIPGPGDLITMAVREGFDDVVAEKFRYDENFPAQFALWMSKQGYDNDWSKRWWRSHWQLPSIGQGFEMFQRLRPGESDVTFTDADLDLLLRTQDIAPYFRERLKAVAYSPLTRVDVRRMYSMGVLNKEQVYSAYRDLGYNEENAKNLLDFTVSFESAEERGLTKDAITASYKRGIIARDAAISDLKDLGYPSEIADFYLDITDYDIQADISDEQLSAIKTLYVDGAIDDSDLHARLGRLNLPAERQNSLVEVWTEQRLNKVSLPSRSELDDFYRRDLIDETKYREYLKKQNYQPGEVDLYVQRIDLIKQEDAQYTAQTASAEADRVSKSKVATQYYKDAAAIDVQIAEAKLDLANLAVALPSITDPDQLDGAAQYKLEVKATIVQYQLDKANLKLQFQTTKLVQ